MKLSKIARSNVLSINPDDSLDTAIEMMERNGIHHLPVVSKQKTVGMVSDRDLLTAIGWQLECDRSTGNAGTPIVGPTRIQEVMSSPVMCLSPDSDVHTAARIMASGKVHAFPLEQEERLIGIVTSTDILACFANFGECFERGGLLQDEVNVHMHCPVESIGPKEPLHAATALMRDHGLRHLPVTVAGVLVGIITDRDVRRICGRELVEDEKAETEGKLFLDAATVMDAMRRQVETIGTNDTILSALRKMTDYRIGCLPVVRRDELVGMLTETDVLRIVADVDDKVPVKQGEDRAR